MGDGLGDGVGVSVTVSVGVGVALSVTVSVGAGVGVAVTVAVEGSTVGVSVGSSVGSSERPGDRVGVAWSVGERVRLGSESVADGTATEPSDRLTEGRLPPSPPHPDATSASTTPIVAGTIRDRLVLLVLASTS